MTGLPDEGSRVVRAQADWTTAAPLALSRSFVDDPRGYHTLLSKIEPGPFGDVHAHNELEQIYVIEGDFFDDEGSYGAGDFVVRAPGAAHRTGSRNGATILLIYSPPATPRLCSTG